MYSGGRFKVDPRLSCLFFPSPSHGASVGELEFLHYVDRPRGAFALCPKTRRHIGFQRAEVVFELVACVSQCSLEQQGGALLGLPSNACIELVPFHG